MPPAERQKREDEFRDGKLPILFCSPTMELGVDIAELNVVNMRNVPPTPANYAQRSGRAGRSGQPALVFTYCAAGSAHDQYFFRRPRLMVAGQVKPPRLDLANEDLVRAHVHAVWLAETGVSLGSSLADVLELDLDDSALPAARVDRRGGVAARRDRPREAARRTAARDDPGLEEAEWYRPAGSTSGCARRCSRSTVRVIAGESCTARRSRCARASTRSSPTTRAPRPSGTSPSGCVPRRRRRSTCCAAATRRRHLQSDFYSYRYFASEGFLPGYSFPRLPLSAFIPARRGSRGRDEFLQRPRFLAISEFGPRSIVYHEGSRYVINRVFLPVERGDDNRLPTTSVKQCSSCGYLHPVENGEPGLDMCEQCGAPLDPPITKLFRLQNVATKRRDRINSDEENRVRQGFDIQTGVRFADLEGLGRRVAHVVVDGTTWGKLTYGGAATLWRINLGWKRRKDPNVLGFVLDTERGYWAKNVQAAVEDQGDAMSQLQERVVPYVEDRRNALLFEPARPIPAVPSLPRR